MKNFNRIVIVEDHEHQPYYLNIDNVFQIEYKNTPPSLWEIIWSKNTVYKLSHRHGVANKIKRELVKVLGKKWSDKLFFEIIFKLVFKNKKLIIVTPSSIFNNFLMENMPKSYQSYIACVTLENPFNKKAPKINKYYEPLTKIKESFLNCSKEYPVCAHFNGNLILFNQTNPLVVEVFALKFPNAKIIVKYVDHVDFYAKVYGKKNDDPVDYNAPDTEVEIKYKENFRIAVNAMKKHGAKVLSYSRQDAKLFGMEYEPNGVCFDRFQVNEIRSNGDHYCFFAGDASGYRAEKLYTIAIKLIKNRVHVNFLLVQLNEDYYNKFKQLAQSEYFNLSVTRKEYKEIIAEQVKSDFVIDFCRVSQSEGYSYRIPEALAASKKIITDRLSIKEEPFYSPENILCSEDLDFTDDELSAFLKHRTAAYPKDAIAIFNVENQCYWPEEWKNQDGS